MNPIVSLTLGDFLLIRIPIISPRGEILNPKSFKWTSPIYEIIKPIQLKKGTYQSHITPIEQSITYWKDAKTLLNQHLVNEMLKKFSAFFSIEDFKYEITRSYVYRLIIIATKQGVVHRSKYLNFDIVIKPRDSQIRVETQTLSLLNIPLIHIEIRVGTRLCIYLLER